MTLEDILNSNPKVKRLINRLNTNEREITAINKEYKQRAKERGSMSATEKPFEHYRIMVSSNGNWENSGNPPKKGGKNLEEDIEKLINENLHDAIKIEILTGKTSTKVVEDVKVYLKNKELVDKPAAPVSGLGFVDANEMQEVVNKKIKETLATMDNPTAAQISLMNKEFELQMLNLKNQHERQTMVQNHEREIEKLNRQLEEKDEEIEDLYEQLNDTEQSLSGAEEIVKQKHKMLPALGEFLSAGIETFLSKNQQVVAHVVGAEKAKLIADSFIEKDKKSLTENAPAETETINFSEAGGNDLSGLSAYKQKGIPEILELLKALQDDDFFTLYNVISALQDGNGGLESEKLKLIEDLLKNN